MSARPPVPPRLVELAVTDLGIIDHVRSCSGPGMTALTGETGAGKTMLVGAIDLLLGGRADAGVVRAGAARRWSRVASTGGRRGAGPHPGRPRRRPLPGLRRRAHGHRRRAGRARPATLVDLHGQHAHQSLLATARPAGRARPLRRHRPRPARSEAGPSAAGSTPRWPRSAATPGPGPGRPTCCASSSASSRPPASTTPTRTTALDALEDAPRRRRRPPGGGRRRRRRASHRRRGRGRRRRRRPSPRSTAAAPVRGRWPSACRAAQAELSDVAAELRARRRGDRRRPGPAGRVRERRQLLVDLRRKYGTAPVDRRRTGAAGAPSHDVIAYRGRRRAPRRARGATTPGPPRSTPRPRRAPRRPRRGRRRRWARPGAAAAPPLAAAVEAHLRDLAMAQRPRRGDGRRRRPRRRRRVPAGRQPRRRPRPARQGGVGRRAGPLDARPAPGAQRGPAGPGVRRGRRRHRRRGRPRRRPGPRRAGRRPPGARGHPPPAGGGVRRRPGGRAQGRSPTASPSPPPRRSTATNGWSSCPGCSRARPSSERVQEAAAELLELAAAERGR